jgi:hypothetical protein
MSVTGCFLPNQLVTESTLMMVPEREHPKFAKIVFSCGVGILPAWVFWAARVAYPTQMYLHNWDAPSRTPLFYGEVKIDAENRYHVIPCRVVEATYHSDRTVALTISLQSLSFRFELSVADESSG